MSVYLRLHLFYGDDTQRPVTIHADNALPNDRLCSSRGLEKIFDIEWVVAGSCYQTDCFEAAVNVNVNAVVSAVGEIDLELVLAVADFEIAMIVVPKGDTTFKCRAGIVGWIALGVDAFDPRRAFADIG